LDAAARAAVLRRAVLVLPAFPAALFLTAPFVTALLLTGLFLTALVLTDLVSAARFPAAVFLARPFAAPVRRADPRADACLAAPARPAVGCRLPVARPACARFFVGFRLATLVPWKRDDLPKCRSAAPEWQGAKSEFIGHK
jgi:hypothetical protein